MRCSTVVLLVFVTFVSSILHSPARAQTAGHVVISEFYGGGGNSGATYRNDFIELYNPTSAAVTMVHWSVQYGSAGSAVMAAKTVFSGTILPHHFFLVQESRGSGGTTDLPVPDAIGTIAMGARAGKIALANDSLFVSFPSDPNVVDFIGWGAANRFEGTAPADSLTNTASGERKNRLLATASSLAAGGADAALGNGYDSNDNGADVVVQPEVNPQNSASPAEIPSTLNQPPVVSALTRSALFPLPGTADTVTATIFDPDGIIVFARLHARVNRGAVDSSLVMAQSGPNTWTAVLPPSAHPVNGTLVEYFVTAVDDSGAWTSTEAWGSGYFSGVAPISSVKQFPPSSIAGFDAQISGVLNAPSNLFANGSATMQDGGGGIRISGSGFPSLQTGRNLLVKGKVAAVAGACALTQASILDTSGSSVVVPLSIALPVPESAQYALEGELVTVAGLEPDTSGVFQNGKNYLFRSVSDDTISVRIESNGPANTLTGKTIRKSRADATGVLLFAGGFNRLLPRSLQDLGYDPADGSGTAVITPVTRLFGQTALAETLTVAGDGISTIAGVSVMIPASWSWTDTSAKSAGGPGLSGAQLSVSGEGSAAAPYTVTISGAAVSASNTGWIVISSLSTPQTGGVTSFAVKTSGAAGVLSAIALSPTVSIATTLFEAVSSGNWSSPATWLGGTVPGASDDVTLSTPGVTVTIDIASARCDDLAMTGSGSGPTPGPTLQFAPAGSVGLTVNGSLTISGGSGSGRGGRAKLTSNGNPDAILAVKHHVTSSTANSSSSGSAGLNMNEGTVRLGGFASDTLSNSAGLRLGSLEIGDGTAATQVVCSPGRKSTLIVRSIRVRTNAAFLVGAAGDSVANDIGNASTSGLPALTGGITVDHGGTFGVKEFSGGPDRAVIRLAGGGIRNDGSFSAKSEGGLCRYTVQLGGFTAAPAGTAQPVAGGGTFQFADIAVGAGDTLVVGRNISLDPLSKVSVAGTIVEQDTSSITGRVEAVRVVAAGVPEPFGGIGFRMTVSGHPAGSTMVSRLTGPMAVQTGNGHSSIRRMFEVTVDSPDGLTAALEFTYREGDLDGHIPGILDLWKSSDGGSNWLDLHASEDQVRRTLSAAGVGLPGRFTCADTNHRLGTPPLEYVHAPGWNIVSVPLVVADARKSSLYPSAVSNAFAYTGIYEKRDTLGHGIGYWLKYARADTSFLLATLRFTDTVDLRPGWNLVGSAGVPLASVSVVGTPPGIVASPFYGYSGGYFDADTIVPGAGYWVKSSAAGRLIFNSTRSGSAFMNRPMRNILVKLAFSDDAGNRQELTIIGAGGGGPGSPLPGTGQSGKTATAFLREGPPPTPGGEFDVRFSGGAIGLEVPPEGNGKIPLEFHLSGKHIVLQWNVSPAAGERFRLLFGPNIVSLSGSGERSLTVLPHGQLSIEILKQEPAGFGLEGTYPNPFNPITSIRWEIPEPLVVSLKVYDIAGREVKELVSGVRSAGKHVTYWNAGGMSSGVYFVRLIAGAVTQFRKIVLMK